MPRKRRTDQEWIELIQQCKASGYTDSEWCKLNGLSLSTFYTKLKLLRDKASLEEINKPVLHQRQEVVEVDFTEQPLQESPKLIQEVAVCLKLNGVGIEIFNTATQSTIENTLHALRMLC